MNNPEPDANTSMLIGSDPSAAASEITYNIGPQVGTRRSELHAVFYCLFPWTGMTLLICGEPLLEMVAEGEGKRRGMGDDRGGVGEKGQCHYVRNGITACLYKNIRSDQDTGS